MDIFVIGRFVVFFRWNGGECYEFFGCGWGGGIKRVIRNEL